MTPASGTPLILLVLSLGISSLSAAAAIAAVLMARANLQRQIQVAAGEAWLREFREQAALFLARLDAFRMHAKKFQIDDPEGNKRAEEIRDALLPAYHTIRLLIAERGTHRYPDFMESLDLLLKATSNDAETWRRFTWAAIDLLERERAALEMDQAVRWRPWSQLKAWFGRGPPRWPT